MRKGIVDRVVLRREIIAFRFAFLTHKACVIRILVHVERDRTHIVEELGIDRPAPIGLPQTWSDQGFPARGDGIAKREAVCAIDDIAEPFVVHAALVRRFSRRTEPALVYPTPRKSERIKITRIELQPAAGMQEGARDPAGCQPQQAATPLKRRVNCAADITFQSPKRTNIPRFGSTIQH